MFKISFFVSILNIPRYLPAGRQGSAVEIQFMDYFVYAIKSEKDGRIYVGMSNNVQRRITEHNNGFTKSTKAWRPWKLILEKKINSRLEARVEEKRLKSGYGKEFLKSL